MSRLLIYGATGYTGRTVAARAKAAGLDLSIAGRDGDKLAALARELGVSSRIFALKDARVRRFDFGDGAVDCAPLSFGDLVTAWHSTRIPNIEMYVHLGGAAFPQGELSDLPEGPSAAERDAHRARAVAEASGADGTTARSVIDTINGYSYTPLAATEAARRVLQGQSKAGFRTPASLFGLGFAASIADTRIIDY